MVEQRSGKKWYSKVPKNRKPSLTDDDFCKKVAPNQTEKWLNLVVPSGLPSEARGGGKIQNSMINIAEGVSGFGVCA